MSDVNKVYVNCSCGGGADVIIPPGEDKGSAECACGKSLVWDAAPQTLGISIGDDVDSLDKFGG